MRPVRTPPRVRRSSCCGRSGRSVWSVPSLSSRDRALFYRKYYYLQSTARIAAELGLTPRAVEGRLYRIRKGLQNKLGGDLL